MKKGDRKTQTERRRRESQRKTESSQYNFASLDELSCYPL